MPTDALNDMETSTMRRDSCPTHRPATVASTCEHCSLPPSLPHAIGTHRRSVSLQYALLRWLTAAEWLWRAPCIRLPCLSRHPSLPWLGMCGGVSVQSMCASAHTPAAASRVRRQSSLSRRGQPTWDQGRSRAAFALPFRRLPCACAASRVRQSTSGAAHTSRRRPCRSRPRRFGRV